MTIMPTRGTRTLRVRAVGLGSTNSANHAGGALVARAVRAGAGGWSGVGMQRDGQMPRLDLLIEAFNDTNDRIDTVDCTDGVQPAIDQMVSEFG